MAKNRQKATLYILILIAVFVAGRIFKYTPPAVSPPPSAVNSSGTISTGSLATSIAKVDSAPSNNQIAPNTQTPPTSPTYPVVAITDGDTIKVNIDGTTKTIRIIGLDTPETVDPTKPVQCFGPESSVKSKELLSGKSVTLESDPTQGDLDKYDRLLRYVFLPDGSDYSKLMISEGFAHEYTYKTAYKYQAEYKTAEASAKNQQLGFWSPATCNGDTTKTSLTASNSPVSSTSSASSSKTPPDPACPIKGNINSSGEKIYHIPGGSYYNNTVIDLSASERWFCNEAEAVSAGWRKSAR